MIKASPRIFGSIIAMAAIAVAIAVAAIVWRPAIAAIEPPAPQSFDRALVKRGRDLAAIGNCNDCHTVRGGHDFAGGLAVPTPFGTIYSSNITPDAETGIGRWSEAAFRRAMQSGVNRDGQHLYPTFPYDHFTHVSDEDDRALYAFLMTRPPVHAPARANQLSFPFDQRAVVAGWKLLFLRHGSYQPDATKPRNGIAAPIWSRDWPIAAPAIRRAMRSARKRRAMRLAAARSTTGMPMRSTPVAGAGAMGCGRVVRISAPGLASRPRRRARPDGAGGRQSVDVPESDVRAIATYMADLFGAPTAERKRRGDDVLAQAARPAPQVSDGNTAGASVYAAACATCHASDRAPPFGGINLALSTNINGPDARNAANIILSGIRPVAGERSPIMPGFADGMSDDQIAALLDYLRARFSRQPPWTNTADIVRESRRTQTALLPNSSAPATAPADATKRDKP